MNNLSRAAAGLLLAVCINPVFAQQKLTPELLWKLGRVTGETITPDGKSLVYGVTNYDISANKGERNLYSVPLTGGAPRQLTRSPGGESVLRIDPVTKRITYLYKSQVWECNADGSLPKQLTHDAEGLSNVRFSPDGKFILFSKEVSLLKLSGITRYPGLAKSNAKVYDDLNYRHWDTWEDGKFQHIFYAPYKAGVLGKAVDIMPNEPYDCPQMPFGGSEDATWNPDSKSIVYVTKKKFGKAYAVSTNTDIYFYNIETGRTGNFTEGLQGYDTNPAFSADGSKIAWLSMAEDGNEAAKNELMLYDFKSGKRYNLTKDWDETVSSFTWANQGSKLFFLAATGGAEQLFELDPVTDPSLSAARSIRQVTKGQYDVNGIVGQSGNSLVVSRADMNHAAELYLLDLTSGTFAQLTFTNKPIYDNLQLSRIDERHTQTTDNKDLLSWVIYPPDFDPAKKYPTLLYCQGGPQSALTQFYSYRWNMQLIAAQGYIVIAPNRRGMPGHGVKWNADISGDWGGQPIRDYLSAIDDLAKEPYVDKTRLGAVGASYGGYSVFMLAGVHEKRFKTFIAHDGLFDLRSWYGTTEELWFANKDMGGSYWGSKIPPSFEKFNPITFGDKWNTPIMIVQGGIDYRVPVEQGLEAFQLAQLKGIKSRLLYLSDENHWVLSPQNALVWQKEFFGWLKETL
ncbi:S9 family peptidase [Hufsiella ginkgonis]|uniref:Prolyl oligopeptidase family serine peptidase n=1 Tax=Hufsiella ginkgonis TaxID=2695274 RepID=A0A7K1Y214_9SPHI|nr:S9 family peptidase [Hufsiella ginkgonis]MXV17300.1 prolyl oligopeptidase family serine peptidase [Hufsiella ginkgonis]